MARGNGDFNVWIVEQTRQLRAHEFRRIVELGPGPGIALWGILHAFPEARVWGVDPSPEMLSQSRKHNRAETSSGRLTLLQGDVASLSELAPVDLILATHVLYFWHQPAAELNQLHAFLRPGGRLALGYQLRRHMPSMAQKTFPNEGHLLYDGDDQVASLLHAAGFKDVSFRVKGETDAPAGRMALATA
jgi:trans-aconitate methyltransferase